MLWIKIYQNHIVMHAYRRIHIVLKVWCIMIPQNIFQPQAQQET
jgi:hypothetical protein